MLWPSYKKLLRATDSVSMTKRTKLPGPYRARTTVPLPLPTPPLRGTTTAPVAEDKRGTESAARHNGNINKMTALRNYRRARGLCFKCGERWGHDHVSPLTVKLHVIEELLNLFSVEMFPDEGLSQAMNNETEEQVCHLSVHAATGQEAPSCLQIHGWLQGQEVVMLIDSGSFASFVAHHMLQSLEPVRVSVANGAELHCMQEIVNCPWYAQGHCFSTSFRFLPLGTYDVILGMDWLEYHSPMIIDWPARTMQIQVEGRTVILQGAPKKKQQCLLISSIQLDSLQKKDAIACVVQLCFSTATVPNPTTEVPAELLDVLTEYEDLFVEPKGLPPRRACDHTIPLMAGAQPVNIRPYRHKPELKSEIEKQVAELIASGVLQKSKSPYSSPALLVLKKDGTWRLCIDYR